MGKQFIIEEFDFERAVDIDSRQIQSDAQREIFRKIGIDQIYFSQDDKISYPAVFIKKVTSFDAPTLELIAKIHKMAWNYRKVSCLYVYNDIEIRIYNCIETPVFITEQTDYEEELEKKELARCKQSDKEKLEALVRILKRRHNY